MKLKRKKWKLGKHLTITMTPHKPGFKDLLGIIVILVIILFIWWCLK